MDQNHKIPPKTVPAELAEELRSFVRHIKRRLREQADVGELTQSQIAVILRLESGGPATTSALARAEGMRPQSMGSIVVALQSAGMIQGAPDSTDGRQTVLSLTDACRKRLQEGRAMRQDWLSKTIEAKLSSEEQEQLASHLKVLMRLVED